MNPDTLPDRFEELPPEERLRVLKAGSAMTHFVFHRAAAVLIATPPGHTSYFRSGSGFVLKLDEHYYLGTAWHVVNDWRLAVEAGHQVAFQIGDTALNPDDRLAWKDEQNDIAFLSLTPQEAIKTRITACEPLLGWRPMKSISVHSPCCRSLFLMTSTLSASFCENTGCRKVEICLHQVRPSVE